MTWRFAVIEHVRRGEPFHDVAFRIGPTVPRVFRDLDVVGVFLADRPGTLITYWCSSDDDQGEHAPVFSPYASNVSVVGLGGELWPVHEELEHAIEQSFEHQEGN